jgi:hypothetical protein
VQVNGERSPWQQLRANAILIDERDGRRLAERRHLTVIGTLQILDTAAEEGMIDFPTLQPKKEITRPAAKSGVGGSPRKARRDNDEAHASIQRGEGLTSEAYAHWHQQHGTPKPFCQLTDGIEILRVIHGARDIQCLFR